MVDSARLPVLELTAQMRGRTARVWVFRDRIEWSRRMGPSLMGRVVMATATEGESEWLGHSEADDDTGSLSIDAISSITSQREGLHARVSIMSMGSIIEMELPRSKAARFQEVLRALMAPAPPAAR